jgi:signal transduction histidine kinase/CheY-like chemotaxis protein
VSRSPGLDRELAAKLTGDCASCDVRYPPEPVPDIPASVNPVPPAAAWYALRPEAWRGDLLNLVVRGLAILGGIAYVPSVVMAASAGINSIVILDTAAIVAVLALASAHRMPQQLRAGLVCLVMYLLGAGLMSKIGWIGQTYLLAFSLLVTLLLSARWGFASVALNALTLFAIGYVGIASPGSTSPNWLFDMAGWSVVSGNFIVINGGLVLALGTVIVALESALDHSRETQRALEHERRELVSVNETLAGEVDERIRSEESLREQRALLRIAGTTARLGGWRVDAGGTRVQWSDEVCVIHEMPAGTSPTLEEAINFYAPQWRGPISDAVSSSFGDGKSFDMRAEIIAATGAYRWVRAIGHAHRADSGEVTHVSGSIQDITPEMLAEARHDKLEQQLRQAAKMETIGSLAGGIAHDFNNLLSIVLSYSHLLLAETSGNEAVQADLREIHAAGLRATELTKQLLAFSRQQVLQPHIVGLDTIVDGMEKMLRRLLGAEIELATRTSPSASKVLVDPGQVEQVILNLAVNARDAMPNGGMLTIETAEVILDERYASEHVGVVAGPHMMLAVTDTGMGMDQATQARMFEPFFTTKALGKGTGFRLATVFGIVKQSGGSIWVYSEVGRGTSFKLYFPIAEEGLAPPLLPQQQLAEAPSRGSETILLVEDDTGVRMATSMILQRYGYHVLEAASGSEAVVLCDAYAETIHLLLTDLVMPRMSGRELAGQLGLKRPAMRVLYMSGYTDDTVIRHGLLEATISFIQKPLSPLPLARKVRGVLDAAAMHATG